MTLSAENKDEEEQAPMDLDLEQMFEVGKRVSVRSYCCTACGEESLVSTIYLLYEIFEPSTLNEIHRITSIPVDHTPGYVLIQQ